MSDRKGLGFLKEIVGRILSTKDGSGKGLGENEGHGRKPLSS